MSPQEKEQNDDQQSCASDPILFPSFANTIDRLLNEEDADDEKQVLYIVRHGDRWDYENPKWKDSALRPGDPPLSSLGLQQASETGTFLDSLLSEVDGINSPEDITWLSSPFLRCIQTSNNAIDMFTKVKGKNEIKILPESSVFEFDGHGGKLHASLPKDLSERSNYFPRFQPNYRSLFVPPLPEPRTEFHARCDKIASTLHQRYSYKPKTALVVVTHAAVCVGLARAAANLTLQQVTPAAPCAVYRLTRTSNTPVWTLEPHDQHEEDGTSMNGHTAHVSDLGKNTIPWNHFGPNKGYSGPPTSRFAPAHVDVPEDQLL